MTDTYEYWAAVLNTSRRSVESRNGAVVDNEITDRPNGAAITTAGDLDLGAAFDEPPEGWTVANPEVAKTLAVALLAGDPARLTVEAGDGSWPDPAPFSDAGDLINDLGLDAAGPAAFLALL